MTPKNRDELSRLLWQVSVSSIGSAVEQGEQIMRDLDAAGLAIVPKVGTDRQLNMADITQVEYSAMLDASPFKESA